MRFQPMLTDKQKNRISKYKILGFWKTRAKRLLSILDFLKESGRLDFKNAEKCWVSYPEWLASCLFYTSSVSAQLPNLREYLLNFE